MQQAQTLGEEGNLKDAIAMYDQAYHLLCNGASYRSSPNMQSVNPEENRLTSAAHLMTSTAILEAHTVSDDAIARFERAAELALTGRRYGIAMHALFLASARTSFYSQKRYSACYNSLHDTIWKMNQRRRGRII